jgi:hypothetical protein
MLKVWPTRHSDLFIKTPQNPAQAHRATRARNRTGYPLKDLAARFLCYNKTGRTGNPGRPARLKAALSMSS